MFCTTRNLISGNKTEEAPLTTRVLVSRPDSSERVLLIIMLGQQAEAGRCRAHKGTEEGGLAARVVRVL